MYKCPACQSQLRGGKEGVLWVCETCAGCSLRIGALRAKVAIPAVENLWARAKERAQLSPRSCMVCKNTMSQVIVSAASGPALHLDACIACALVWFDASELSGFVRASPPKPTRREVSHALEILQTMSVVRSKEEDYPAPPPITLGERAMAAVLTLLDIALNVMSER